MDPIDDSGRTAGRRVKSLGRRLIVPSIAILLSALVGYGYGSMSFAWDFFPKPIVEKVYKALYWGDRNILLYNDEDEVRDTLTQIEKIIDSAGLTDKSQALIRFVTKGHPELLENIALEVAPELDLTIPFTRDKSASVDYYLYRNPIGVSHVVIIRPTHSAGKLFIYQEGHFGGALRNTVGAVAFCAESGCFHDNITSLIDRFLDDGYTVALLWLPWFGPNIPGVRSSRFGAFYINHYRPFRLALDDDAGYLQAMVFPIVGVINQVGLGDVILAGLSYGANIVPLAAAVDDRIDRSYSVDGGVPFFIKHHYSRLRSNLEDAPGLRNIVNSLELYILAGRGEGRKFVQMLNNASSGSYLEVYRADLERSAQEAGACFRGIFDDNREHEVSDSMIDYILADTGACD